MIVVPFSRQIQNLHGVHPIDFKLPRNLDLQKSFLF